MDALGEIRNLLAKLSLSHCAFRAAQTRSRTDVDSQFDDTVTIRLNPPYCKALSVKLNEFGIAEKLRYSNEDLAAILHVHPSTIQWRCDRNRYGQIKKDAAGRRYFTIDDLRRVATQERTPKELTYREILTLAEAARFLDLSYDRVRYLVDAARIPCVRVDGRRVIARNELVIYKEHQSEKSTNPTDNLRLKEWI